MTKILNPRTKRMITVGGRVYNKLIRNGNLQPLPKNILDWSVPDNLPRPLTEQYIINPITKRMIKIGNDTYQTLINRGYRHVCGVLIPPKYHELERAFNGYVKSYEIVITEKELYSQLNENKYLIKELLKQNLQDTGGIKAILTLKIKFAKYNSNVNNMDTEITNNGYFNSSPLVITNTDQIDEQMSVSFERILEHIAKWLREGSNWKIKTLLNFYVSILRYEPLQDNSYIKLPKELQHPMKGLINIQNNDNECFRWCHLAYKFPVEIDKYRPSKYKQHIDDVDYKGITFPVTIKQIPKIENQNNISISVFGYSNKQAYPIYISKQTIYKDHLDLLLITRGDSQKHYVWIKDFNRFMHGITNYDGRKHFCKYCLQHFTTAEILNQHIPICFEINGTQAIRMPTEKNKWLSFENYPKQLNAPFVIYADFESLT